MFGFRTDHFGSVPIRSKLWKMLKSERNRSVIERKFVSEIQIKSFEHSVLNKLDHFIYKNGHKIYLYAYIKNGTIDRSDFGVVRLSDVRISAFHCILFCTNFRVLGFLQSIFDAKTRANAGIA